MQTLHEFSNYDSWGDIFHMSDDDEYRSAEWSVNTHYIVRQMPDGPLGSIWVETYQEKFKYA